MNTPTRTLTATAVTIAALIASPAAAHADDDFDDLYRADKVCYVLTDDRLDAPQVPVLDFALVDDSLNAGYTSWSFKACIPLSCPAGTFLVSGNLCATDDPFAHIPVLDDSDPTISTAELLRRAEPIRFAEDSPFWAGLSIPTTTIRIT